MSREIIEKIKETEQQVTLMQEEIEKEKQMIRKKQKEILKNYQQELEERLLQLETKLDEANQQQLNEVQDRVKDDLNNYRRLVEHDYQAHQEELINAGVREVMSSYGNFSHETGHDHRGASQ